MGQLGGLHFQKLVVLQIAVAGLAINSMQFQFIGERLPRQDSFQLGWTHLLHVLKSHVFADAHEDLIDLPVRKPQPLENVS